MIIYNHFKYNPGFRFLFYYPEYGDIFSSPDPLQIENGDNVTYTANYSIRLKNFKVINGGTFKAQIISCPSDCAHASKDAGKETTEEEVDKQTSTNIDEFCIEKSSILLYPNPAKQTVTIEIKIFGDEKCNCTITDISGKQYFLEQFDINNKYFKKEINLSTFPAGIYFVSFRSNNLFETKKLIVNK
ncbi:MAG: T9SS type A sorting domain-containing protein [Bacteroidales bacterium]|nr:T9SS type A sorting domain-containing protein [Bacteroidales bacterium]